MLRYIFAAELVIITLSASAYDLSMGCVDDWRLEVLFL